MAEALGDWLAALALAGVDVGAPEFFGPNNL